MRFGDQARVLRMIPGLEHAEFLRFGQVHRNTYINAPALLAPTLQLRTRPEIFFAGQISGVEGYVESIATGLIAGRAAVALANGDTPKAFPRQTALGSLCHYVSGADPLQLSTREHHVRSAAQAGRSAASDKQGATRRGLPAGAGRARRIYVRACLSCRPH